MSNPPTTPVQGRGYRILGRTLVTAATAVAFVGMASVSASAAPGNTGAVTANVNVSSTITLALGQTSFNLNGLPSTTVSQTGAVTGTVTTNNVTGYSVSVVAQAPTLQPTVSTNTDDIPIGNLHVHDADGVYRGLSTSTSVTTTTQATRSALAGDAFSDDYSVDIPDVNSDTYHVTLDYTATATA